MDSGTSCTLDDTESPGGMDCPGWKVAAAADRMETREPGTPVVQKQDSSPFLKGSFLLCSRLDTATHGGGSKESRINFSFTESKKLELVLWGGGKQVDRRWVLQVTVDDLQDAVVCLA